MLSLFEGETEAPETLRYVEEKLGMGLFALDLRTGRLRWSDGLYALFGLDRLEAEPSAALMQEMIHPEDRRYLDELEDIAHRGVRRDCEFRIVSRNGRIRWVASHAEGLIGWSGKTERVIGIVTDVTAEHETRTRVAQIEQHHDALVKALGGVIWIMRADQEAPRWRVAAGRDALGIFADGWLDSVHPDDRPRLIEAWRAAADAGAPCSIDHRVAQHDGSYRWARTQAVPIAGEGGSVVEWIGASFDVHARETAALHDRPTGAQIRGARGILNWSVRDLAQAARVSPAVIRRLEDFDGRASGAAQAAGDIRHALERAGIEFVDLPDGKPAIRLR